MTALFELFEQWLQRHVPAGHCLACAVERAVGYSELNESEHFCTQRCLEHFHTLKLGHKRVLEIDTSDASAWDQLPDEMVVALLEVMFSQRETDDNHFQSLGRFRLIGERYKRLIDQRIYPVMRQLPRSVEAELDDEKLLLFVRLERLKLYSDTTISHHALLGLSHLTRLCLFGYDHRVLPATVCALTGLVHLKLDNYQHPNHIFYYQRLSTRLVTLSLVNDTCLVYGHTGPIDLTPLVSLQDLRVKEGRHLNDTTLGALTQLTRLSLNDKRDAGDLSHLTAGGLSTLTNLTDLRLIHLFRMDCNGLFPILTELRRLVFIAMDGDEDVGMEIEALPHLTRLKSLHNAFTGAFPMERGRMTQLVSLEIDLPANSSLKGLVNLRKLIIHAGNGPIEPGFGDGLTDDGMRDLIRLEKLALKGAAGISAEGLKLLGGSLRRLDLQENRYLNAYSFISVYQWLPLLEWLNIQNSLVSPNHAFYPVVRVNPNYKHHTDPGYENEEKNAEYIAFQSVLKDHLPVGCYVIHSLQFHFRVVAREGGLAWIQLIYPHNDIVRLEHTQPVVNLPK